MTSGYNPNFLGSELLLPSFDHALKELVNTIHLAYTNFSVFFSNDRKMAIYTAVNIDGTDFRQIDRDRDKWKYDSRLPEDNQLGNDYYRLTNEKFHKGHIVRRLDPCWGENSVKAEDDTFHFTNAVPQHKDFNPRIWLELERAILEKGTIKNEHKISVFSGPVLSMFDKPLFGISDTSILIPTHFWKVIIWEKQEGLFAVGFMQSQKSLINNLVDQNYKVKAIRAGDIDYYEKIKFKKDAVYQVNINLIQELTGLDFGFKNVKLPYAENEALELELRQDYAEAQVKGGFRGGESKYLVEGLILG